MGQIDWKPKKTIVSPKLKATGGVDYESAILTIQEYIDKSLIQRGNNVIAINNAIAEKNRLVQVRDKLRAGEKSYRAMYNRAIEVQSNLYNSYYPNLNISIDKNIADWKKNIADLSNQKIIADRQAAINLLAGKGIDANANEIAANAKAAADKIIADAEAKNNILLAETKTKILESSSKTNKRIIIAIIVIAVITTAYIIYKRRKKA